MTSGEMRDAGKRGPSVSSVLTGVTVEFMVGLDSRVVVVVAGADMLISENEIGVEVEISGGLDWIGVNGGEREIAGC